MKRFIKLAVLGILVACSSPAFAQQKFGYINFRETVYLMPEIDSINIKLQQLQQDHSDVLDNMQVELNTKYQEFQKNSSTYSVTVRQTKERELGELRARLEEFYTNAREELVLMEEVLFAPLLEKARNAVNKVGRENDLLIVFDQPSSGNTLSATLYMDENDPNLINISLMVRKELGISPDAKLPEMSAATQSF